MKTENPLDQIIVGFRAVRLISVMCDIDFRNMYLLVFVLWVTCCVSSAVVCPPSSFQVVQMCTSSSAVGKRVFIDSSASETSITKCTCFLQTSSDELEVNVIYAPGGSGCGSKIEFQVTHTVTFECVLSGIVIRNITNNPFDVVLTKEMSSAPSSYCIDVKAKRGMKLICKSNKNVVMETQEISTETAVIPPDTSATTDTPNSNTSSIWGNTTNQIVTGETTPVSFQNSTVTTPFDIFSTTKSSESEESKSAGLDTTTIIIIAVVAGVVVIAAVVLFVVFYISRRTGIWPQRFKFIKKTNKKGKDVRGHNYVYYNEGDMDEEKATEKDERETTNGNMAEGTTNSMTRDNVMLVSDGYDLDKPEKTTE